MTFHAVVSGAGIAAPALAHQLAAIGWHLTVIERFPNAAARDGTSTCAAAPREIARRMGIEDDLRAANNRRSRDVLHPRRRLPAAFPRNIPGKIDGPTAELEIRHGSCPAL